MRHDQAPLSHEIMASAEVCFVIEEDRAPVGPGVDESEARVGLNIDPRFELAVTELVAVSDCMRAPWRVENLVRIVP